MAISSVIFELWCAAPRTRFASGDEYGKRSLCFDIISRILSNCVPAKRWSGLTQARLSHLWHTFIPSGIGPLKCSKDKRDATTFLDRPFGPTERTPYPSGVITPVHLQHVSDFSIFAKNLSSTGTTKCLLQSKEQNFPSPRLTFHSSVWKFSPHCAHVLSMRGLSGLGILATITTAPQFVNLSSDL